MKNYKLLTTAIITALDATNPTPVGSVWNPVETLDVHEAEALARIGIAQETKEAANVQTVAERRAGKAANKAPLSGIVDATRQEDGTFKNKNGQRVNEDGTDYVEQDEATKAALESRIAFLARPADQVIAGLAELTDEQKAVLPALFALENGEGGKQRKTVLEAIKAATKTE